MLRRCLAALTLICLLAAPVAAAPAPGLIVLQDTGETQGALPILKADPAPDDVLSVLAKGFSGTMLHLYQYEQTYLNRKTGSPAEPAYLLLSNHEGGFPRFGLVLDGQVKQQAGYVDLHKNDRARMVGKAGTMDQIFPHELFHVIRQQLAGPREGASGKLHAVGVQTDRETAFDEGFAESMQIMAADDPGADPATREALSDPSLRRDMEIALDIYREAVAARWAPGSRARLTFTQWFSADEQFMRYVLVKENAFARAPLLPDRLVGTNPGHLLENVLAGGPNDPPKTTAQMLETEGVVSYLFYRWATDATLQNTYRDDAFYAQFGATRGSVTPMENVYLKLFHVLYTAKPKDAVQTITAYKTTFPDEAAAVDGIVKGALLGQCLPEGNPVWLLNDGFQVSRNLFDQFKAAPTANVFDLNAATVTDLVTVQGVDRELAEAIQKGAPYRDLTALEGVPGMKPEMVARFRAMAAAYDKARNAAADAEQSPGMSAVLMAYLWRILLVLAVASVAGTLLYRRLQPVGWVRAAINGLAAAGVGLGITLLLGFMNHGGLRAGPEGLLAVIFVMVLFGLPAALGRLIKRRGGKAAGLAFAAWLLAVLPVAILVHPWF